MDSTVLPIRTLLDALTNAEMDFMDQQDSEPTINMDWLLALLAWQIFAETAKQTMPIAHNALQIGSQTQLDNAGMEIP